MSLPRKAALAAIASLTGGAVLVPGIAFADQSQPAGNNGTIKIDQYYLTSGVDAYHANDPQVSCQFALSF